MERGRIYEACSGIASLEMKGRLVFSGKTMNVKSE